MTVDATKINLSQLAELMGHNYTEADAASFAEYLVIQGYQDTDDLEGWEWELKLERWEDLPRDFETATASQWMSYTDWAAIADRFDVWQIRTLEDARMYAQADQLTKSLASDIVAVAAAEGFDIDLKDMMEALKRFLDSRFSRGLN